MTPSITPTPQPLEGFIVNHSITGIVKKAKDLALLTIKVDGRNAILAGFELLKAEAAQFKQFDSDFIPPWETVTNAAPVRTEVPCQNPVHKEHRIYQVMSCADAIFKVMVAGEPEIMPIEVIYRIKQLGLTYAPDSIRTTISLLRRKSYNPSNQRDGYCIARSDTGIGIVKVKWNHTISSY